MAIIMMCSRLPQQGKDTATKYFEDNFNGVRVGLADKVKEIATLMGWNGLKDERGRKFLVDLGTVAGRTYDKDMWLKLASKKVEDILSKGKNVILSDVRFTSEERYFRDKFNDTIVIGIESNKIGDKAFEYDLAQIEYKDIKKDFVIQNNGTIEEFYEKLNNIIKLIKGE
jgi:hypothetical protein